MENCNKIKEVFIPDEDTVSIRLRQDIIGNLRLGTQIKITPKANACLNKPGYEIKYFEESVTLDIGIGKDHTAELSMTKDAWNALNAGAKVHVTTTEEFKKNFIHTEKK